MNTDLEDEEMDALAPIDQAKVAINHVLKQIRNNPEIGYRMGLGTQSFALLTKATATLWDKPLEEVRQSFNPVSPRK